ncbi:MAG: prepilin-type N-terminal cleavage/methylation domain-containing protein [Gemmatimonadaceae bacterium]
MRQSRQDGYTLVEVIIALVVFTTGALGLAAGSAVVARELGTNGLRAEAARVAASRHEIVHSACRSSRSGSEARGQLTSAWTISPLDSTRVVLAGSVSYQSARGTRGETYSATIGCR